MISQENKQAELLTVVQAAEKLGIQPRVMRRRCQNGKIPTAKKYGKIWLIEA